MSQCIVEFETFTNQHRLPRLLFLFCIKSGKIKAEDLTLISEQTNLPNMQTLKDLARTGDLTISDFLRIIKID